VVIHDGRIIEQGTHAGLLKQQGMYYDLYVRVFRSKKFSPHAPCLLHNGGKASGTQKTKKNFSFGFRSVLGV